MLAGHSAGPYATTCSLTHHSSIRTGDAFVQSQRLEAATC